MDDEAELDRVTSPDRNDEVIEAARLELLLPAIRKSFVTSILSITIFSALLWRKDPSGVGLWIGLRIGVSAACMIWLARLVVSRSSDVRLRSLAALMALSGTIWGLIPALIQPAEPEWLAILVLWIFGNQMVITAVCGADRTIFLAAIVSVTGVSALSMLVRLDGFSAVLAGLIVFGGLYATSIFQVSHASTIHGIEQRLTAERLAASLHERQGELRAANQALDDLAHRDVMTGLTNRRGFIAEMADEERNVNRLGWMGIIDLDGFKAINDTFGHGVGDEVLIKASQRWSRIVGDGLLARTGGDEFAFVVDAATDAEALARRIVESLAEPIETSDGSRLDAFCSVGVGRILEGDSLSEAMARADRALYDAKEAGRNAVEVAADR